MLFLLGIIWLFKSLKYVLFWVYLWQLKDYHIGRLADHFRTHKGRQLVFNFSNVFKFVVLLGLLLYGEFFDYFYVIVFLFFIAEAAVFAKQLLKNNFRRPVKTKKTLFLLCLSTFFVVCLLFFAGKAPNEIDQLVLLLLLDMLLPIVISVAVLLVQPFAVLARNGVLAEAREKMQNLQKDKHLTVIAITGSYGKTSTKEFLAAILSKKFNVLKTKEHQNSEIGVAKCILNDLKPEHQIFIAEVGAYNKGKVKEVCTMLKPKMGIVTGVNQQHMALFGSLDNLLSAEGGRELANLLPENGVLFLNGDNKYCLDLYKKFQSKKRLYAESNSKVSADVWTENATVHQKYLSFVALNKNKEAAHFNVQVLGRHNIQNLLGAMLVAKEFGMSFEQISEACKAIVPEQAGMAVKNGKNGIFVIDSSYSANPDGVNADLDYLNVFQGKKAVVMPCLIELGPDSSQIHQKIGQKIGSICNLAIITTKDKFLEIKKGAIEAGMPEKTIIFCENSQDICQILQLYCKSGDAVLLEGRVPAKILDILVK